MKKRPLRLTVAILTVFIMLLGLVPSLNLPSSKVYAEDNWVILGGLGDGPEQFDQPHGIAIDSDNKVYIADYGNNRIQAITFDADGDPTYEEVLTQETLINGEGLDRPRDVAVDGSGNLYVTDSENQRVLKGTKDGESYNWSEVADGFRLLTGIAVDNDGNLFVTDNESPGTNYQVKIGQKMGDGSYNWTAINEGDGRFGFLYGIFVDGEGNLYVADNHNGLHIGYEGEISFDYSWARVFDVNSLSGVAVDCNDDYYYVVDESDNKIHKYQTHTGDRLESWGVYGDDGQPGHFCYAYDIAINNQGDMFVVDQGKHNIQVLKAPPPAPNVALEPGTELGTTRLTGLVAGTEYEYVLNWDSESANWDSSDEATALEGGIIDNIYLWGESYIHIRVKDPVSAVKVLTIEASHIKQELTPAESVDAAKLALSISNFTFGGSDNKDSVTQNFTLPLTGENGTTISWSVDSGSDYVSINGDTGLVTVTRPANGSGDDAVTLTATISKDDAEGTKTFSVTILEETISDADSVSGAAAALAETDFTFGGSDNKDSVTQNFTLPLTGENGTTISWSESSDNLTIDPATGIVSVTRPIYNSGNTTVSLTAVISKGIEEESKTLSVIILQESSDWEAVGGLGLSAGNVEYTSLAEYNGTLYLAYKDAAADNKVTVMQNSGSGWSVLGAQGFSAGAVLYTSICTDPANGDVYLAYYDSSVSKAVVKKYADDAWSGVGAEATAGGADMITLAVNNGTPYIVYRDTSEGYYAKVSRFNDGTWEVVGGTSISPGLARGVDISFDSDGNPYVFYMDDPDNNLESTPAVKQFDGTDWVLVGSAAFADGFVSDISLYIDGTTPYVAFSDIANEGKATVMKYDGTSWVNVGSKAFTADTANYNDLIVYHGIPYLVFADDSQSGKASVMKKDGSSWSPVGSAGFSEDQATYLSLAAAGDGLYLGYRDRANGYKASVEKLSLIITDDAAVSGAAAALAETDFTFGGSDNKDSVTQNFTLPLTGENGTTISWSVDSGSDYVSINGDTGLVTVTRPGNAGSDATVVLSAAISKGSENDTKQLTLKIIKEELQPAAPGEGDGTENSPYLIADATNMLWLAQQVNGGESFSGSYFKQTADIDLAGIDNFTPIGNSDTRYFSGIYDGDNKKISNLTISAQVSEPATATVYIYYGLFGYLSDGEMKNVILEDVDISMEVELTGDNPENKVLEGYIGGIAGHSSNSTLENCRVLQSDSGESKIEVTAATGRTRLNVGGIVGYFRYNGDTEAVINRCVNEANLSTANNNGWRNYFGGIAAFYDASADVGSNDKSLQNSYNTGNITISGDNALQTNYAGGITACKWNSTVIQKTFNTGNISISGPGEANRGGIIGELNNSAISDNFYLTGTADHGIASDSSDGYNSSDAGAAPKTDEELKTTSTFDGWDATIWNLVAGSYPGLKLTAGSDPVPDPDPDPPSGGGGDSSPAPAPADRTVPVIVQDGQGNQLPPSDLTITRDTVNGVVTDKVVFTESKAGETVSQASQNQKDTAVIHIDEVPGQKADAVQVEVPKGSLEQLSANNMALNIVSDKAQVEIPKDTVSAMKDQDIELSIREQKDTDKVNETKGLMVQLASGSELVGTPMVIESNITSGVMITLPLDSAVIPSNESELEALLESLAVLIEHSDGENKIDKGQIKYDENGKPIGISIWVEKFSTFSVIGLPVYQRISGDDRIKTAIAVSQAGWPDTAEAVVLANAYEFADALAGVTLGSLVDGPILLTAKESLTASTLNEISRLKVKDIYIAGGSGAISRAVEDELTSKGYNVRRISGEDRLATAVAIGDHIIKNRPAPGKVNTVFLAYGYNFADALSCSTFAAQNSYPILLSAKDKLDTRVKQALTEWQVENVVIAGGSGVISSTVESELREMNLSVTRLGGTDRYETAKLIIEHFCPETERLTLTTGQNFPDSLSGALLAAKKNAPIMIFNQRSMTNEVKAYVKGLMNKNTPYILGGEKALPQADLFFGLR